MDMAVAMGVEILTEEQYFELQKLGEFDTKTSSWIATQADIRKLGGALYGDRRYGQRVRRFITVRNLTAPPGFPWLAKGLNLAELLRLPIGMPQHGDHDQFCVQTVRAIDDLGRAISAVLLK